MVTNPFRRRHYAQDPNQEYRSPDQFEFDPQTGMPIGTNGRPSADQALAFQYRADEVTRQRQQALWGDAANSMRQGLNLFQSYRPGGSAALASGIFGQQAGVYQNWAANLQSPDLMSEYRHAAIVRAQRMARRQQDIGLGLGILNAGVNLMSAGMLARAMPTAGPIGGGADMGAAMGLAGGMAQSAVQTGWQVGGGQQPSYGPPASPGMAVGQSIGGAFGYRPIANPVYGQGVGETAGAMQSRPIASGSSGEIQQIPGAQPDGQGKGGGSMPQQQQQGAMGGGMSSGFGGYGTDGMLAGPALGGAAMRSSPYLEPAVMENVLSDPSYVQSTLMMAGSARSRLLQAMSG